MVRFIIPKKWDDSASELDGIEHKCSFFPALNEIKTLKITRVYDRLREFYHVKSPVNRDVKFIMSEALESWYYKLDAKLVFSVLPKDQIAKFSMMDPDLNLDTVFISNVPKFHKDHIYSFYHLPCVDVKNKEYIQKLIFTTKTWCSCQKFKMTKRCGHIRPSLIPFQKQKKESKIYSVKCDFGEDICENKAVYADPESLECACKRHKHHLNKIIKFA